MKADISPERAATIVDMLRRFNDLKRIERSDYVEEVGRHENSAEHTWHALLVLMAYKYIMKDETIDYAKAYELLLIHDLPEIVSGDTPIFDEERTATAPGRERSGLKELLSNSDREFAALISTHWEEFETLQTPEALLAKASDKFQGSLQNLSSKGRGWRENAVTMEQLNKIYAKTYSTSSFFSSLQKATLCMAEEQHILPGPRADAISKVRCISNDVTDFTDPTGD